MKKIFGFRSKGPSPLGPSARPRNNCVGFGRESASGAHMPRYHIHDKDMGKIHKAASVGDVAKVQHILILGKSGVNDRDKKDRTALHLACAYGHPEVVTLLVERKCEVDARDGESSTALIKAVQCQEEECATILLEHGANPDVMDSRGNTALHYAVLSENTSIVAKLLAHNANMEAKNKNVPKINLTELWAAAQQSKKNQTKCGIENLENSSLFDNSNSNSENEDAVEIGPGTSARVLASSPSCTSPDPVEGATEPAIGREENGTDIVENASQENDTDIVESASQENGAEIVESASQENGADVVERASQEQPNHSNLTYASGWHKSNKSEMMTALGLGEDEDEESPWDSEPSIKKPDPVLNKTAGMKDVQTFKSEQDLEEQKGLSGSEDSQRKAEEKRKYKNNEAKLSGSLYNGAADRVENGVNQQSGKTDDQQFPMKGSKEHDRGPPLLMKEMKKTENEKCVSRESVTMPVTEKPGSPPGGPLHLQDGSSLSDTDQSETRPTKKTSNKNNKVRNQVASVDDLDDLNESSETASEDCELQCPDYESVLCEIEHLRMECRDIVSLLKIRDAVYSYKRLIEFKRSHCELLTGKLKRMENKFKELQKEVSETKEVRSLLEHEKAEWEQELSSLRFALKQEEEKRRSADLLSEKTMEQLRRKDEQYQSEVEMKQQLEVSLRTLDMELKTVRNHLNQVLEERNEIQRQLSQEQNARMLQDGILANHLCKQKEIEMAQKRMTSEVSVSHEKEKDLLHKNQRLQDEIAMLRLEMDTVKRHNQEKEKKYLEDIKTANEKSDKLQRTIKLNEETFTKTIFQYNGQLNNLTTENTMLSSKLENEKQNKERLETDVESFRSRLASAMHDHAEIQASKRDLEIAFQRARDEWLRLQDKMNFDLSNLRDNNEILSQQLSKTEKKLNSLEIEFHHTKDALREKTLALRHVQRDLNQTQCQMKEVEHLYQDEQGKVNKYMGKQESIEERLSQLQSENMLLRQQLDDASNKADSKDKTIVNIQDQFHDMLGRLQAEGQKHRLMLEERNKELVSECSHFKERLCQYENEKAEREVVVRQLQQELADTLKKQSMSEASLEVSSRYRSNLENEARDLKKKLGQLRSQSEDDKEKLKKLAEVKESLECTLEQEQKRNDALEEELREFKELLKKTKKELSEHENRELNLHQDIKNSQFEMDIPVNMLIKKIDDLTSKLETTSSKCLHLGRKNQVLQQELLLMKTIQKKCVKLEKNKRKLEQEVESLRSHMEKNMVEHSQVQQYRQEVEEQARQDLVEKLKQVNLFLQAQAASQENLEQLRESSNASVRSQMELRIKDLESQLSRMKSQEDFDKIELEKYKQLYQEELRVRKSLSSKLNKTNERLEEASTKLLLEEQQNRSLLSSLSTRPIVECPCVGGLHNSLVFNRTLIPRENIVIPSSSLQPSNKRMEIYLTKCPELSVRMTREWVTSKYLHVDIYDLKESDADTTY
ncbi:Ankyrin repeat domain-containing protein 26 [Microtus ochrogaster]|uniref:Ankyrin repeat domain-containing protein 26 n=1 Tax=Microtus ochrogaster TaxID=79684 RepID=A0A8J6G9E2_MICOH|nr:Ankyrin repeat domain-containing protein 26 [Microtus ochrogaster]